MNHEESANLRTPRLSVEYGFLVKIHTGQGLTPIFVHTLKVRIFKFLASDVDILNIFIGKSGSPPLPTKHFDTSIVKHDLKLVVYHQS